ncbi:cell division protein FtsX [Sphaerisporangium melleum]|uniref:Cell division protein FtsX n=1 Tax=Sphaerisporangium melleum TaxID=321316 RepID=A0A917QS36_9ACTN|nr:permease-like cell division protein FtsX [Sphaerisporangium melleum]GGK64511.1 cell division protein FtsX [Sphaerisporangium melleum]GII70071.1 cell division protein FtsX [Sphaerisporangium melleum]
MRANFIFSEVWIGLRRNLTMTIAVIVTVAIGMALLGIGLMINAQVGSMSSYWSDKVQLSAFLCAKNSPFDACKGRGGVSQQEKVALQKQIEAMPQVDRVTFENQEKAYENFKAAYSSNSVFLSAVKVEDMPESFRVKLKNPDDYKAVFDALSGAAGVANVVNDQQLLDRFFGLMNRLRSAALVVALIQVFAAILLIGNTVRLSAYNRRRETGIMRLVGASNLYIQLPFVMEGTIAGLVGGVISAVLLMFAKIVIFDSMQKFFALATQLTWSDVAQVITLTTVVGVLICILASFVTLRRYLRV